MKNWIVAACLALVGCTASYQKQDLAGSAAVATVPLSSTSKILTLSMADTANGGVISNTELSGRSRIMSITPMSPESLLSEPVQDYVDTLYAR